MLGFYQALPGPQGGRVWRSTNHFCSSWPQLKDWVAIGISNWLLLFRKELSPLWAVCILRFLLIRSNSSWRIFWKKLWISTMSSWLMDRWDVWKSAVTAIPRFSVDCSTEPGRLGDGGLCTLVQSQWVWSSSTASDWQNSRWTYSSIASAWTGSSSVSCGSSSQGGACSTTSGGGLSQDGCSKLSRSVDIVQSLRVGWWLILGSVDRGFYNWNSKWVAGWRLYYCSRLRRLCKSLNVNEATSMKVYTTNSKYWLAEIR